MDMYETIISRRTIRRFSQKPVDPVLLKKCVNAARLAPSAANLQPLEYLIVTEKERCARLFETLGWAAYLQPKWTPSVHERPTCYIVVLVKDTKNPYYRYDVGFAAASIICTSEAKGIGSCVLCNIQKEKIQAIFKVPPSLAVDLVIALGYKAEAPVVEERDDTVKYWRDQQGVLHVPKRKVNDIIHMNGF
jgi:nitroreductase